MLVSCVSVSYLTGDSRFKNSRSLGSTDARGSEDLVELDHQLSSHPMAVAVINVSVSISREVGGKAHLSTTSSLSFESSELWYGTETIESTFYLRTLRTFPHISHQITCFKVRAQSTQVP